MSEICPAGKCTGCGACSNVCPKQCIVFKQDKEGFFFPEIDTALCVECNLCRKVCPANSTPEYHTAQETVYAAWALDDEIRQSSSSGGLYSVFANYCFSCGGVANGVHLSKDNFFVHGLFDTPEAIKPCRGSKYVQSQPGNIYKEVKQALGNGKMVLFTGTPCQVNALYKFLGRDYENLYTCDFVCHGVPSPQYFKSCLNRITGGSNDVENVTFRNLAGWGKFAIKATDKEKCFDESIIKYSYIKTFLNGANYRYACYSCAFARGERVSDITLGDFWGLGKYKPFLRDASKGASLMIVNTDKGQRLLDQVKDRLFLAPRTFREASRENHQLRQCVKMPENRSEFYNDVQNLSDAELLKKYAPGQPLWKKLLRLPLRIAAKLFRISVKICYSLIRE